MSCNKNEQLLYYFISGNGYKRISIHKISLVIFAMHITTNSFNEILQLNKMPNKYNLTTQRQIATSEYIALIDNFFKLGFDGFFKGEKGISIYYKYFLQ